jgi:phosphatidylserine synthase|tara:strand:- start:11432 stop:12061 length:630 start_codon:yes stop_codon:yes gene_type:complete
MKMEEIKSEVIITSQQMFEKVNHFAKLERFIAVVLIFTPLLLYLADDCTTMELRDSYWFGSLLTLAGALFIYNGAQHMSVQKNEYLAAVESRFGKGYNIIFGLALFGVLFFNHVDYKVVHYSFAIIFFVGCALAMLLTKETPLKRLGDFLGVLTLLSLGIHFLLSYVVGEENNSFTLLWAEWLGLFLIAIYFIVESIDRDMREKSAGMV